MQITASDLKSGIRVLKAAPGFTTVALIVIALGIGATVSVFSVVNAVLLRSLPYGHPEKLVYLWSPNENFKGVPQEMGPNVPDYYDWKRDSHNFSDMTLFRRASMNFVRDGTADRIGGAFVTGTFFHTLEVSPRLGRSIDANDDRPGHERVAVISDAFWHSHFGGESKIVGKEIQLDRQNYTVIGVMPKDFGYPFDGDVPYESSEFKQTDIWLPAAYTAQQKTDRQNFLSGDAIGRLRDGVSPAAAQAELAAIESRLQPLYPEMWRGWTGMVTPLIGTIVGPVEKLLWLLLGAVGIVLLIAISNLANLLLARSSARAHELGIRTALGADRSRIVRQLLTESLVLSLAGGALGIALAYAAVRLLTRFNPGGIPRFDSATVDGHVLFVAVLLSIATGALSGIAPAISASKANVNDLLKKAGSRIAGAANRGRFALIVVEVALSVILLTASGLLIRSYLQLAAVNPDFSPATLTFKLILDERYNKPELQRAFYRNFLEKLQNMPGVRGAGASSGVPLSNHESVTAADIRGYGPSKEMVEVRTVTPEYRTALGTPLLRGRDFDFHDVSYKPPVVIVNKRFAAMYFHGRDPLGGQVRTGIGDLSNAPWATVVGVVANVRNNSLEETSKPMLFQPADQGDNFAIRCSVPTAQVIREARATLGSLDPVLTLEDIRTMGERIRVSNARRSFQTTLLTGFAGIAVFLALAGLYGLMSYTVKQRTAEIGVRLAIGSSRGRILTLFLAQGLRLTGYGLLIGIIGAGALTRLLRGWLYGVKPIDPTTFSIVPLFILAVACCACISPAWSATRIDPVQALRQE
ncbi:MAG TPA: ABC transporter permease [Bryobacteraceae bacterium]|nr:ABC transporter permease [Bryobacteraceae bacterium]